MRTVSKGCGISRRLSATVLKVFLRKFHTQHSQTLAITFPVPSEFQPCIIYYQMCRNYQRAKERIWQKERCERVSGSSRAKPGGPDPGRGGAD